MQTIRIADTSAEPLFPRPHHLLYVSRQERAVCTYIRSTLRRSTSRIIRIALSSEIDNHPLIFKSTRLIFALPRVLDLLRAVIYQFERPRHFSCVTKYSVSRLLWRAHAEFVLLERWSHKQIHLGPAPIYTGHSFRWGLVSLGVITALFNVNGQT